MGSLTLNRYHQRTTCSAPAVFANQYPDGAALDGLLVDLRTRGRRQRRVITRSKVPNVRQKVPGPDVVLSIVHKM